MESPNGSTSRAGSKYAVKVWKNSLRLAELKKLEYDVTGRDPWGMIKKEKALPQQEPVAKGKKKKKSKKK